VGPEGEERGLRLLVEWDNGHTTLSATQKDFETRRAVNSWLARNDLGSRAWLGTDKTAYLAWSELVEQAPEDEVLVVQQAGRYDLAQDRVFVYSPSKALSLHGGLGVAWSPRSHVPLEIDLDITHDLSPEVVRRVAELTMECHTPDVIYPAVGWMAATPLKPIIEALNVRFPILLLYGQRGSGKTTLLRDVLLPLVGVYTDPLGADVSRFALLSHLGQFNALPAWLGEFRSSIPNLDDLQMYLRMAYDGGREERGRPDQTVTVYPLTAPVVVDGEAVFPDSALRERTLAVRLTQSTVKAGKAAYKAHAALLQLAPEDRKAIAGHYVQWTLSYGVAELADLLAEGLAVFEAKFPYGRLVSAAAIVGLGLQLWSGFLAEHGGELRTDATEHILKAVHNTYIPGLGVRTAVDHYCEIVAHAYAESQPWASDACEWEPSTGTLWFNVTMTLHWVRRFWRELPEKDLVEPQLQDRKEFYLVGPERRKGGGLYWGIAVKKAQKLGLDVPEPRTLPQMEV